VQSHRDKKAAARFFRIADAFEVCARVVVTDKLASYSAPCAELLPTRCIGATRG